MGQHITNKQWTHGCYVRNDHGNMMVIKEKHVTIDEDTKEVVSVKNRLTINDPALTNPKRRIFITKPQFRVHKYKKETEDLSKVDMHIVEDRTLRDDLKRILGVNPWERTSVRKLCNSPYVYNADVSMETLVRIKYNENRKHAVTCFTNGAFDIEQSILGCDRINVMTYIHENKIFVVILEDFFKKCIDRKKDKFVPATKKDLYRSIEMLLGEMPDEDHVLIKYTLDTGKKKKDIEKLYELHVECFDTEPECIFWLFEQIHREETDFIGVWNIAYDIPAIVDRLEYYGIDPKQVFCHPSVPDKWKLFNFKIDKMQKQHIVDKWHWLYCTSMSQFIDSMLLYARIRKAKRKKSSYTLESIAQEELGFGKIKQTTENTEESSKLTGTAWHRYMQTYAFCDYIAYNINDALLIMFMEEKNHDCVSMWNLTKDSPLSDFSKQSVMLKNSYYKFGLENGRVFATTGENMVGPYDHLIGKVGGAVLRADLCRDIGMHCIKERPDYESMIIAMVSDLDYKAIYPSYKSGFGISKETKIATAAAIEGLSKDSIEPLFGGIANPIENAVWIGHDYFDLPNFEEMQQLSIDKFGH